MERSNFYISPIYTVFFKLDVGFGPKQGHCSIQGMLSIIVAVANKEECN